MVVTMVALTAIAAAVQTPGERDGRTLDPEVRRLLQDHEFVAATALASTGLVGDPNNALLHELLGDAQHGEGRDLAALDSYRRALLAGGEPAHLAKKVAWSSRRLMRWGDAAAAYHEALRLAPGDAEAREDLRDMRLSRGLQLRLWGGGWELDRARLGAGALVSYGGLDRSEVHAGYVRSDQVYYETRRLYAQYYFHYAPESYAKLEGSWKTYEYPASGETSRPNPDSAAYGVVPSGEVEVAHRLREWVSASLAYQLFAPTLFHDRDTRVVNHKVSVGAELRPLQQLRLMLVYALLRDPDPERTLVRGRTNSAVSPVPAASTRVVYRFSSLLGGGIGWTGRGWGVEVQYLPNRDLDGSYAASVLTRVTFEPTDRLAVRLQHVHDRYSDVSAFSGRSGNVALLGADYRVRPALSVGAGVKVFGGPLGPGVGGFLSMILRTGFGL